MSNRILASPAREGREGSATPYGGQLRGGSQSFGHVTDSEPAVPSRGEGELLPIKHYAGPGWRPRDEQGTQAPKAGRTDSYHNLHRAECLPRLAQQPRASRPGNCAYCARLPSTVVSAGGLLLPCPRRDAGPQPPPCGATKNLVSMRLACFPPSLSERAGDSPPGAPPPSPGTRGGDESRSSEGLRL